jgi:hypothetical protein
MGFPLKQPTEDYQGQGLIDYLTEALKVSPTMLAALLEVTERTLGNWKNESLANLRQSGKGARLVALYDFVAEATREKVPQNLLLNLLEEPVNPAAEESQSPLFYIVNDPTNALLRDATQLLIARFLGGKR